MGRRDVVILSRLVKPEILNLSFFYSCNSILISEKNEKLFFSLVEYSFGTKILMDTSVIIEKDFESFRKSNSLNIHAHLSNSFGFK